MGLCCDLLGWREGCCCSLRNIAIDSVRVQSTGVGMIRIFPDFSVQVTAAGGGAAGGMPSGPAVGRVPGTTNGNPQNVQGITSYQQRGAIPQSPERHRVSSAAGFEASQVPFTFSACLRSSVSGFLLPVFTLMNANDTQKGSCQRFLSSV
ncbi:hypothetical protein DPEC_G00291680 [Dallia pectoralis]|uniref:Uncharacterized protein n=1 Tax=Dallia pectoralis TaxID=75939 RepID=A0ACC2FHQ2_DALPE|nr:hypothetical protein DPEC_G00291680 [Dallia pectoralis]